MAAKIVVDAGHDGISNPGATYEGRRESDDVLRLAMAVGNILEEDGYDVIYTRTGDTTQTVNDKARLANEADADFFVSLHRNSAQFPDQYNGVETLIYGPGGIRQDMAENVNEKLEEVGFRNIGVSVRPNLVVLNSTDMPAILIEAGFINSRIDNQLFDEKFDEIAHAIADGIEETLEENITETPTHYRIQVGAFRNKLYADNLMLRLKRQGYPAYLSYEDGLYKVQVGEYERLDNAVDMEQRLKDRGYVTFLTM